MASPSELSVTGTLAFVPSTFTILCNSCDVDDRRGTGVKAGRHWQSTERECSAISPSPSLPLSLSPLSFYFTLLFFLSFSFSLSLSFHCLFADFSLFSVSLFLSFLLVFSPPSSTFLFAFPHRVFQYCHSKAPVYSPESVCWTHISAKPPFSFASLSGWRTISYKKTVKPSGMNTVQFDHRHRKTK